MHEGGFPPLEGMHILVTRAAGQNRAFSRLVREAGGATVELPLIATEAFATNRVLDEALQRLDSYAWLMMTSGRAAEALDLRLDALGLSWAAFSELRIAAVGSAIAAMLRERGLDVAFVPDRATGKALAAGVPVGPTERILLLQGDIARQDVVEILRSRGLQVDAVIVYGTQPVPVDASTVRRIFLDGSIRFITLASPSAVRSLADIPDEEVQACILRTPIGCIGPTTAEAARLVGWSPAVVADEPTPEGLLNGIIAYSRTV